jgi:hypothetical protein
VTAHACNVCGSTDEPTWEAGGLFWCDGCAGWRTDHSAGFDEDTPPRRLPLTYCELMWKLSHCDDCGCEHTRPTTGCLCVCHAA